MGAYKINGIDLYDAVGFVADGGRASSNSFERPHDLKPIYEHVYEDENGKVIDLVSPRFKQPRSFRIEGTIVADSESDYKAKKSALLGLLETSLLTVYVEEIDVTVNATHKSFSTWQRLTKVKDSNQIATRVGIDLDEVMLVPVPTFGLWYGASGVQLTSEGDVLALNGVPWTTTPSLITGTTNRYFHMVVAQGVNMVSVMNVGALFPDITDSYQYKGTIEVEGVNRDIYTMEIALPYSTSKTHLFELAL